jgi:hypothetical protein
MYKACKKNQYISKYSYLILCCFILLFIIIRIIFNPYWVGDYPHLCSVINELAENPVHPLHPIYGIGNSYPYFNPYFVFVGFIIHIFNLNIHYTFIAFGIMNLIGLFLNFHLFINYYFKNNISTIALLLIVFLWGIKPYTFSNFLNFNSLIDSFPYHSTFSLSFTFLSFYLCLLLKDKMKIIYIIFLPIIISFAILAQPLNSVFILSGIIIFYFYDKKIEITWRKVIISFVICLFIIIIILIWPYYSIFDTLSTAPTHMSGEVNLGRHTLYSGVFLKTFPIIILGMMALWNNFINKKILSIHFLFLFLILFYLVGIPKQLSITARTLSPAIIILQIIIAGFLKECILLNFERKYLIFYISIPIILYHITISSNKAFAWPFTDKSNLYKVNEFNFINTTKIKHYDIVLADRLVGYYIPLFKGKLVSYPHDFGSTYINNYQERNNDVDIFFSMLTSNFQRKVIIEKYKANFILIDCKKIAPQIRDSLETFGNFKIYNDKFLLITIR